MRVCVCVCVNIYRCILYYRDVPFGRVYIFVNYYQASHTVLILISPFKIAAITLEWM